MIDPPRVEVAIERSHLAQELRQEDHLSDHAFDAGGVEIVDDRIVVGERFAFSCATRASEMSTATTSFFWASRTAFDRPTYPIPATAIFMGE